MEASCTSNMDNCSSGSYSFVSHTAFDGSYSTYVESCGSYCRSATGTSGFYVGTMNPVIEATSFSVAPSSSASATIPSSYDSTVPASSGIYACSVPQTADYSTVPSFAYVIGTGETVSRFCPCETPSYVSMAPPFCWSSSQAALCGSYRCRRCGTVIHRPRVPVYGGAHCAYPDPDLVKNEN